MKPFTLKKGKSTSQLQEIFVCLACRKIVLRIIQFSNLCFSCAKMHHLFLTTGSIRSSCHKMTGFCHDRPCMHGGKCTEGWNRYICDCSQTSFSGATCGNGKKFNMILGMEFKGLAPETVYIQFPKIKIVPLVKSTMEMRSI